jgi:rhodanese-related sulfurtransferase
MAAKVLDIRTPAEVDEGHIEGAIFVDFRSPDFEDLIVKLAKNADYIIYCRSGGRVSEAIPLMRELGFTGELTNAGGLDDASALTGLPIVGA